MVTGVDGLRPGAENSDQKASHEAKVRRETTQEGVAHGRSAGQRDPLREELAAVSRAEANVLDECRTNRDPVTAYERGRSVAFAYPQVQDGHFCRVHDLHPRGQRPNREIIFFGSRKLGARTEQRVERTDGVEYRTTERHVRPYPPGHVGWRERILTLALPRLELGCIQDPSVHIRRHRDASEYD